MPLTDASSGTSFLQVRRAMLYIWRQNRRGPLRGHLDVREQMDRVTANTTETLHDSHGGVMGGSGYKGTHICSGPSEYPHNLTEKGRERPRAYMERVLAGQRTEVAMPITFSRELRHSLWHFPKYHRDEGGRGLEMELDTISSCIVLNFRLAREEEATSNFMPVTAETTSRNETSNCSYRSNRKEDCHNLNISTEILDLYRERTITIHTVIQEGSVRGHRDLILWVLLKAAERIHTCTRTDVFDMKVLHKKIYHVLFFREDAGVTTVIRKARMLERKSCGAFIKTDEDMTTLTVCNHKHTGEHPVTLHSLLSSRARTASAAAVLPVLPETLPSEPAPSSPPATNTLIAA
ncbi:hypothetical protein J6590_041109 [Homalodisca vitripennis]|nr:hypothetical protein J6590_041109 [Homalodisca vitripennis]